MRRIVYREDGGVSVITPAPKSKREDETEAEWLKRVFGKATPEGSEYEDIDTKTNPLPDRRFRNAWKKGLKNAVEVSLSKAKDQVLSEVRAERDKELTQTDGLMARANEIGTQAEIDELKAKRQRLRDLPATIGIEDITTVEELQAEYPETVTPIKKVIPQPKGVLVKKLRRK